MNNQATTLRYQRWNWIGGITTLLTIATSYYAIKSIWPFGPDWWTFHELLQILKVVTFSAIRLDNEPARILIGELNQQGWQIEFVSFLTIPTLTCTYLSYRFAHFLFYREGGIDNCKHLEGPRLIFGKYARKHARKTLKYQKLHKSKSGLVLHSYIQIPHVLESGNLIAIGSQGSGKSVVLKPIIQQIIERSNKALIYDAKKEYTELFFGKRAILINPTDERSHCWNIQSDVTDPESAQLMANCLLTEGNEDKFWVQGARIILAGCLVIMCKTNEKWGWRELKELLNMDTLEIRQELEKYYPDAKKLVEPDSKTTQGFFSVLSTQLTWLSYVTDVWGELSSKRQFSIKDWLTSKLDATTVIVPNDPAYPQISGPLCSALITLLTRQILSQPDVGDSQETWLILDELADLPKTDALEKWLAMGRSKGAKTLAGMQNTNQLSHIYGDKKAETILSLFSNILCMRLNSHPSAKIVSENIGTRRVRRYTTTTNSEGQKSTSGQIHEEPIVRAEELTQLPSPNKKGVTGYLSIKGMNSAYKLTWAYPNLPIAAKAFSPRRIENRTILEPNPSPQKRGSRGRIRA